VLQFNIQVLIYSEMFLVKCKVTQNNVGPNTSDLKREFRNCQYESM